MNNLLYVLIIILMVFVLLLVAAILRTILIKKELPEPKKFESKDSTATEKLSEMIKVPTVSIRGESNRDVINKFHKRLAELFPLTFKTAEITDIDGALLLCWRGKNSDFEPIILMSHQDVVPASGDWKYPPFSGTIADGRIYGRGTVDTKGSLCAIFQAVEELIAENFQPNCDVYIASSNNEEITGDGAVKTVEFLRKKGIHPALVLDEGGNVVADESGTARSAYVGIFEKGRANVRFTARSGGGHASIPFRGNPIARLAAFVNYVETGHPFKCRLTEPIVRHYAALAPYLGFRERFLFGNIWLFRPILPLIMRKMDGIYAAQVSTTCIFTQAQGSGGANVIPSEAYVVANMRFSQTENMTESIGKITKIAEKYGIETKIISGLDIAPASSVDSDEYRFVSSIISEVFGEIPVIPNVMLAGTDSRHYTQICDNVLRFVPLVLTNDELGREHAIDESISCSAIIQAVDFYKKLIKNYRML